MNLRLNPQLALGYKSPTQITRVVSEAWGIDNLYCANCPSPTLSPTPANTRAIDYFCPRCRSSYQLKSSRRPFGKRINDGAYEAMIEAILGDNTPNLFLLRYDHPLWTVRDLFLVPQFLLSRSSIEKRTALTAKAERAGWVGCNILLNALPPDAKIPVVTSGKAIPPKIVRYNLRKLQPLKKIVAKDRGWTLDVLWVVRSLGKEIFTNADIYAYESHFQQLYPNNRHIRDKIRQQLQVLRDSGFLKQPSRGVWEAA